MPNIFQDPTKKVPEGDNQIVRVSMEELEIGGRKSHLPNQQKSDAMTVRHIANQGSK